ncbi:MAG TPA: ATP-binding cassette domain-containing protein [Candidatus Methylomirabilis sp.]|nr:ATP-binding cassette domain-containing protein [Candidatus Methylomirabilis sp.]
MTTNAVETVGLTRRFGALTAVNDLRLSVPAGSIFGLLGRNGAGKTVTIKMLTTLLPPSSGHATVAGFDIVAQATQVRRRIGYVPQMLSADGGLTGYENLLVSARLYNVNGRDRRRRIAEGLALMELEESADTLVRHYSGGMIRRLEIAQGLLHRPAVLFLDEPTVGLDPVARHAVWEHLRRVQKTFGTTLFLTTHYMDEAETLCDHAAILHRGQLAVVGSPAELMRRVGPDATFDDVFAHFTSSSAEIDERGYREAQRARRTARRLG